MKILILDYHCASNRGDAGILEGVMASLQRYFPGAEFTVMTEYPSSAKCINQIDSVRQPMVPFKLYNPIKNIASIYALIAAVFVKRGIVPLGMKSIIEKLSLQPFIEADLIISKGGGFLNDFYALASLGRLWGFYFAKLLGKPVVLYAQSIGPLNRTPYRQIARYVLNKVDLITLRDNKSKEILQSMGVNKPPIYVTFDAAFAMPLAKLKPIQLWRYEDIVLPDSAVLKISISVRKWGHYEITNGHRQYVSTIASLADWFIREKNARVYFVSTCTGFDGYHTDDRVVAHEVIEQMEFCSEKNPTILCGEYTPQELVKIYKYMDLHIGTRMHSNIFALLAKTPVVTIGYEFKTIELMKLFDFEEYFVDINHIKLEDLKNKADRALANREKLKSEISNKLPKIKIGSEYTAKLVVNMIKGKKLK
jgi:colanic acid/amylovoran biosynthesis protein